MVAANRDKKMVIALEKGKAGLSNRAVAPIFYEKEHIGSVEFGMAIEDNLLFEIKSQIGCDISIVSPDGDGFKYSAKTHNLSIPVKKYPFLKKMMQTDKVITKRVSKNNRELVTTYGPIKDYSGNIVSVLAVPIDITETLLDAKKRILKIVGIGSSILIVVLIGLYFFFQRMVNRPVQILKEQLEKASSGDMSQDENILALSGKDAANRNEFAELGRYCNMLLDSIRDMVRSINVKSSELNDSAGKMTSVSRDLSDGAGQSADLANNVARASQAMSQNMDSVAAATEEAASNVQNMSERTEGIGESVASIQTSTGEAKNITSQAVEEAVEISDKMSELGTAANDIGKVTETITEISEQTNLLALNATIEAARAGEAGKGFAVVANEIKDLAKQTAMATSEISGRIDGIQRSTGNAVEGIEKITSIIKKIDSIVTGIADALDEQGHTLHELTDNIQQAGAGISEVAVNAAQSSSVSHEIADDVEQVNNAAAELSKGSSDVLQGADELKQLAEDLRSMISRFKLNS